MSLSEQIFDLHQLDGQNDDENQPREIWTITLDHGYEHDMMTSIAAATAIETAGYNIKLAATTEWYKIQATELPNLIGHDVLYTDGYGGRWSKLLAVREHGHQGLRVELDCVTLYCGFTDETFFAIKK